MLDKKYEYRDIACYLRNKMYYRRLSRYAQYLFQFIHVCDIIETVIYMYND